MYIQVKSMDGKLSKTLSVSRTTSVLELKQTIEKQLDIDHARQKLYYKGKQLEDDFTLFEYGVKLNDVVQVLEIVPLLPIASSAESKAEQKPPQLAELTECLHYKVGEPIDCLNDAYGAWFEAKIVKIEGPADNMHPMLDNMLKFHVRFTQSGADGELVESCWDDIRPQAVANLTLADLSVGDTVMANYNITDPTRPGYWYNMTIDKLPAKSDSNAKILGLLTVGRERMVIHKVAVPLANGIMRIELPKLLSERKDEPVKDILNRPVGPECNRCRDNPKKKCKECSCKVCGGKEDPHKLILCDECDAAYHIGCLNPPLAKVPDVDDWYCAECKNDDVSSIENKPKRQLKVVKKESGNKSRDWGKGMATVGRSTSCTIVPNNFFGAIPGIDVGTTWKFRMQCSEAGVHRPPVGGIHGREKDGAYSLVLSGGYEDDVDNGEEFIYTGSGGRDLSGNKRTSVQSRDQDLSHHNMALAMNCATKVCDTGADAGDKWRDGKPIRVLRNYKLAKHSTYAPSDGNRYDGTYKVVKYYSEVGKSGFKVWRFVLRRDDPVPAPWTKAGKKRMAELGLEMIYPVGFVENQAAKEAELQKEAKTKKDTPSTKGKKNLNGRNAKKTSENVSPNAKRPKLSMYTLPTDLVKLMKSDANARLWESCQTAVAEGKPKFLAAVQENFTCICCQELVLQPITTACLHNICKTCLKRSFDADIFNCPNCRAELGKDYKAEVNNVLAQILQALFPGYQLGH